MARVLTFSLLVLLGAALPPAAWALGPNAPFAPAPLRVPAAAAPATQEANAATPGAAPTGGESSGFAGTRTGRAALALIDGQWWPLGAQITSRANARLVAVSGQAATLRHEDGRQERLNLFLSNEQLRPSAVATRPTALAARPANPALQALSAAPLATGPRPAAPPAVTTAAAPLSPLAPSAAHRSP